MELYLLWLSLIFEANYALLQQYLINNPTTQNLFSTNNIEILPEKLRLRFLSDSLKQQAEKQFAFCQKNNIHLISILSDEYPINLQNSPAPPPILYYKGSLSPKDEVSVSIVGSRNFTPYGKVVTQKLAYELASAGITIISGMARGIDTISHQSAINAKSRTIAVLGNGIDVVYPSENKNLYDQIAENGAILSEFPLHTSPIAKNFPIRNRIVAGLSLGTLVIEAAKKSGTLITARLAAEAGREVYAVPGNLYTPTSEGTNELIKDGAKIITTSQDIINDLQNYLHQILPSAPKTPKQLTIPLLNPTEQKIYNQLSITPTPLDILIQETKILPKDLLPILADMELCGHIKQLPGGSYIKENI